MSEAPKPYRLSDLLAYFLRLGSLGFGGPVALVGFMQRDLVDERRWISEKDFKEGLALAQLAPGPLAAQLAIYLGWLDHGVRGATLVAFAFVLPSFLMVLALSAVYVGYGGLPWMRGAFYGIGAAVIAMIARGAYKLARTTVGRDPLYMALFAISAGITAWTESELVWVFVLCGVVAYAARGRRTATALSISALPLGWLLTGQDGPATQETLWKIGWYFAEAGAFVFGSGLAIVPFLHGGVVNEFHWLSEQQFLDAVAVAMITPGPVVITVAFIGFLVAGPAGAFAASVGVFLPCYLLVVIPARYFRRAVHDSRVKLFVDGVTVAAAGAIAGAAFVLGRRAIYDGPTIVIAAVALFLVSRLKARYEPLVILGAGLVGLAWITFFASPAHAAPSDPPFDTGAIERLTGAKGAFNEKESVFKVSIPRDDLSVVAAGVRLTPPMGLTSWAAFKRANGHTIVMGDIVLLEDQVNPVMSEALDAGLEVTALHNHFFWDDPKVMFMHIAGMGDEATVATAVGRVFAKAKETSGGKGSVPRADIDPAKSTLDPKIIDAALGTRGELKSGVYKVVIGREATMHGAAMGSAMGVNTWAAFAGSDRRAVVDGDFAMRESELQGVLKALRAAKIDIVAIHHHMSGEEPRILFLHFWGIGTTRDLARGLKSALDTQRP